MNSTAVIIYPRVNNNASRIFKQANYLIDNNIEKNVVILSMFHDDKLEESVNVSDNIAINRVKTKGYNLPKHVLGDSIKFLFFFFKCTKIIWRLNPDLVVPHSLSVLPIGIFSKIFFKRKVIYDAHELETERNNLNGLRQRVSKLMERCLIRFCDKVIVVNENIAEWYISTYKLSNVYSVPNYPMNPYHGQPIRQSTLLRDEFKIPNEAIIFIYQGILSKARGTGELLDIFKKKDLPPDRVIVFMGMGEMEEEVKNAAKEFKQIFFKPAVAPHEIFQNTSSADVGLFIILEKTCLSYQLSLPNKFMEYCISGLFICVNDSFKVMKKLIEENHLGKVIGSNIEEVECFVRSVTKKEIEETKVLSREYRKALDWSLNKKTLAEIFARREFA